MKKTITLQTVFKLYSGVFDPQNKYIWDGESI